MKYALAVLALFAGSMSVAACGHSSTQEATADCQKLAKTDPTISGKAFDACVACFESCSDCGVVGTSPVSFACPGDEKSTSTGATGSTSSTGTGG